MRKMERILMGGRTYPIRIDLNVLEEIQDGYGSVNLFERELLGIKIRKDKDGNEEYDVGEPSIRAVRAVLPLMINEGLAIEAAETGREYVPVGERQVMEECDIPFDRLAGIIHQEFRRCFGKKG